MPAFVLSLLLCEWIIKLGATFVVTEEGILRRKMCAKLVTCKLAKWARLCFHMFDNSRHQFVVFFFRILFIQNQILIVIDTGGAETIAAAMNVGAVVNIRAIQQNLMRKKDVMTMISGD